MPFDRASGILLHPTSFPARGGIGDLGPAAHEFIDFLARAKQHLWQVLPLCSLGYGNSPYSGTSAFAGNELLISLEVAQLARRVERAPQISNGRVGRPRSDRICSVKGCEQSHVARGLCKNHYQQMRYVEKKAASGVSVRRRRSSGALAPLLDAAKAHETRAVEN